MTSEFNDHESEDGNWFGQFALGDYERANDLTTIMEDTEIPMTIVIFQAPQYLIGGPGPELVQMADDHVCVLFSEEYVDYKIKAAFNPHTENPSYDAALLGTAFIVESAVRAVNKLLRYKD